MTARNLLFMNPDEGYNQELAPAGSDTALLPSTAFYGLLDMNGGGGGPFKITNVLAASAAGDALVFGQNGAQLGTTQFNANVNLNGFNINNLASPGAPGDAVNREYVDALISGFTIHESVRVKTAHGLGTQAVLTGSGGTGTVTLTTETMDVKLHSEALWTTITFISPANIGAVASQINSQYGSAIAFVNGNNIDLKDTYWGAFSKVETQNVNAAITTQVGIPNSGSVSGVGFTSAGSGATHTLTAPSTAVLYNTIDGVSLALNNRVLVSMESGIDSVSHIDNGVYYVSLLGDAGANSFTLHRSTDADQALVNELASGLFTFVTDGVANINTGWTETLDIVTMESSPVQFAQFSGAPSLTYDQGLIRVLSSVKVDLDTAAGTTGAGAGGGTSGLEFDVNSATGKLRVAVNATSGAIERSAAGGLKVRVDGTSITVVGNQLVAASSSSSPTVKDPVANTVGAAITKGAPVYVAANNTVELGDTDTDAHARIVGLAATAVPVPGAAVPVDIVPIGLLSGVWAGTGVAGAPYYLASGGGLTTALPGSAKRVIQVGKALNTNDLLVMIHDFGKKA